MQVVKQNPKTRVINDGGKNPNHNKLAKLFSDLQTSSIIIQMLKISHRINSIKALQQVPPGYGVELDLRDQAGELILQHDPFKPGESFDEYLKSYKHSLIILNLKSEGLEERVLELVKKYQVKDYFMLDLSLPYLVKHSNQGLKDIAIRYSEYEPIELASKFIGKVDWVWLDCFNGYHLPDKDYAILRDNFKLCMVSPELQGYPVEDIALFKNKLGSKTIDAVCTKRPELW